MKKTEVLFTKEQIKSKVKELAQIITNDYKDKNLLIVSLLKGSFIFTADLVREIDLDLRIEFMVTSSYMLSEESKGVVKIEHDLNCDIKEYDVLIVDDIIDTGYTMEFVYNHLIKREPKSLKMLTFLDKPSRRVVELNADYTGYKVEDVFIVGYGLNSGHYYRNIDHIFIFV